MMNITVAELSELIDRQVKPRLSNIEVLERENGNLESSYNKLDAMVVNINSLSNQGIILCRKNIEKYTKKELLVLIETIAHKFIEIESLSETLPF